MQARMEQYLERQRYYLQHLEAMWADPLVQMYNDAELPENADEESAFLAGPTSRNQILVYNHRCILVNCLRICGYKGRIFVPEPRGQEERGDFTERGYIHRWESSRLIRAKRKVFWVPRNSGELTAVNTNFEWGYFVGKTSSLTEEEKASTMFIGWPTNAERMGLPHHYTHELEGHRIYNGIPQIAGAVTKAAR